MAGVETTNLTRRSVPRFAYTTVAKEVLPDWEISLVFVGPKKAQELNMQLRKKTYTPNVLSYEVGDESGEIFICLNEAAKQAPAHEMDADTFVLYLFIHGLLHLKGWPHGSTMERSEKRLLAKFAKSAPRTSTKNVTQNSNRNRYRDVPSQSGRRRGTR